jgi:PBP1b-binding outer membrane lipoprotein LpoB
MKHMKKTGLIGIILLMAVFIALGGCSKKSSDTETMKPADSVAPASTPAATAVTAATAAASVHGKRIRY